MNTELTRPVIRPVARRINGLNLDALDETVVALRERPEAGQFRFRVENTWLGGGHTRTRIHRFYGACEDRAHEKAFVIESDLPPVALGTDRGPEPAEYLLAALAACLTTSIAYLSAQRGIRIDEMQAELMGDIDFRGFLGVSKQARPGYRALDVTLKIESDASERELNELLRDAQENSSVLDMLVNPVPVRIEAERSQPRGERK